MNVRISVLDTSPIVQTATPRDAIHNTIRLAKLADQLGYHRYWMPEHHSMPGVASAAPDVLTARVAGVTEQLRVGSGGVLLPNHTPLMVAERFGTLEALYPGRIDLGLGRAPGGPPTATETIHNGPAPNDRSSFTAQLTALLGYLGSSSDQPATAVPAVGNHPTVWLLGSTTTSAAIAAEFGLPYAFAHHLKPANAVEATRTYRQSFRPSTLLDQPTVLVSVSVIAADTDQEAEWLAGSTRLKVLSRLRGNSILLPPPEEAAAYPYTADDRNEIAARSTSVLVGAPDTVRHQLQALLDETGAEELMITTPVYKHDSRAYSYQLVRGLASSLVAAQKAPT